MTMPEVWLRGPLDGFARELMPVAHSLVQVREEVSTLARGLSRDQLWSRPGGAASVGFHLKHLAGSLDRLLTYARGEALGGQLAVLDDEARGDEDAAALTATAMSAIERALHQVRATPVDVLFDARAVGRARLPSTVVGLLFHAAEHSQRHAGQAVTTAKIVSGP
jgi:uncharacterized damage-inducible protein DinB